MAFLFYRYYMDFYFVGINAQHMQLVEERNISIKPNLLYSMAYMTPKINSALYKLKSKEVIGKLALDSGAFSLNSKSSYKIKPDALFNRFMWFAKYNIELFDIIINFDISFSPDSFDTNMKYLRQLEKERIYAWPVVHDYMSYEFKKFINLGYENIAFGKGKQRTFPALFDGCIDSLINGASKVHMLGVGTPRILLNIPFTSADAKSALDYARYGIGIFVQGNHLEFIKFPQSKNDEDTSESFQNKKHNYLKWLHSKGIDIQWHELCGKKKCLFAAVANMVCYAELEKKASQQHIEIWKWLLIDKQS